MRRRKSRGSPEKSILLGILLMIIGAPIWQAGQLLNNSPTTLTGLLFFVGGIIVLLVGIADYLGVDI